MIPSFDTDFMAKAVSPAFRNTNYDLWEGLVDVMVMTACDGLDLHRDDFYDPQKVNTTQKEAIAVCFDKYIEQNHKYYASARSNLQKVMNGNPIFREAWIPANEPLQFTGLSWSWNKDGAHSYLITDHPKKQQQKESVMLRATVKPNDVDVFRTILTNIHYSGQEQEIRLLPNARPFVTHICRGNSSQINECLSRPPNFNQSLSSGTKNNT